MTFGHKGRLCTLIYYYSYLLKILMHTMHEYFLVS